jgi:hypothetical protein
VAPIDTRYKATFFKRIRVFRAVRAPGRRGRGFRDLALYDPVRAYPSIDVISTHYINYNSKFVELYHLLSAIQRTAIRSLALPISEDHDIPALFMQAVVAVLFCHP